MPIIGSTQATIEQDRIRQIQMTAGGLVVKHIDKSGSLHETSIPIGIGTNPPTGKYKVTNLWVDPLTGKLTVEYDDTPV